MRCANIKPCYLKELSSCAVACLSFSSLSCTVFRKVVWQQRLSVIWLSRHSFRIELRVSRLQKIGRHEHVLGFDSAESQLIYRWWLSTIMMLLSMLDTVLEKIWFLLLTDAFRSCSSVLREVNVLDTRWQWMSTRCWCSRSSATKQVFELKCVQTIFPLPPEKQDTQCTSELQLYSLYSYNLAHEMWEPQMYQSPRENPLGHRENVHSPHRIGGVAERWSY